MKKYKEALHKIKPSFINKNEAYDVLRNRRVFTGILFMIIACGLFVAVINLSTIKDLYTSVNVELPLYVSVFPYIAALIEVCIFICGLFLLLVKPNKEIIAKRLSGVKDDEIVRVVDILSAVDLYIPLFLLILVLSFVIVTTVGVYLPASQLADSLVSI